MCLSICSDPCHAPKGATGCLHRFSDSPASCNQLINRSRMSYITGLPEQLSRVSLCHWPRGTSHLHLVLLYLWGPLHPLLLVKEAQALLAVALDKSAQHTGDCFVCTSNKTNADQPQSHGAQRQDVALDSSAVVVSCLDTQHRRCLTLDQKS